MTSEGAGTLVPDPSGGVARATGPQGSPRSAAVSDTISARMTSRLTDVPLEGELEKMSGHLALLPVRSLSAPRAFTATRSNNCRSVLYRVGDLGRDGVGALLSEAVTSLVHPQLQLAVGVARGGPTRRAGFLAALSRACSGLALCRWGAAWAGHRQAHPPGFRRHPAHRMDLRNDATARPSP